MQTFVYFVLSFSVILSDPAKINKLKYPFRHLIVYLYKKTRKLSLGLSIIESLIPTGLNVPQALPYLGYMAYVQSKANYTLQLSVVTLYLDISNNKKKSNYI